MRPLALAASSGPGLGDRLAGPAFLVCALLSASVAIALLAVIGVESARFFSQVSPLEFFARTGWAPFAETPNFGVLPLLAATAQVAVGALCIAAPLGLLTALYIAQYASGVVARGLNAAMGGLAGVPTVILGYLALNLVTPALRGLWGGVEAFNALSACIAVGAMLLPTV